MLFIKTFVYFVSFVFENLFAVESLIVSKSYNMNKTLTLAQSDKKTVFCVDPSQRGLTRIANTVVADLRAITGANPRSIRLVGTDDPFNGAAANADRG